MICSPGLIVAWQFVISGDPSDTGRTNSPHLAKSPILLALALAWAIGLHLFVILVEEPRLER